MCLCVALKLTCHACTFTRTDTRVAVLLLARTCGQHMGWRFTATRAGLSPRHFWGIRRPGLLCATGPGTTGSSSSSGSDGEQQGPGLAAVGQEQNWLDLLMQGVRRGRLVLHLRQQQPPEPEAGGGTG